MLSLQGRGCVTRSAGQSIRMTEAEHRPQFSVLGRLGIVFTVCVVALQVWSGLEFFDSASPFFPRYLSHLRASFLPILSFPVYALLYFVIMGRVAVQDVVLFRWLYRVWGVSAISGLTFYFIIRWVG